jgi:hypothetical protein
VASALAEAKNSTTPLYNKSSTESHMRPSSTEYQSIRAMPALSFTATLKQRCLTIMAIGLGFSLSSCGTAPYKPGKVSSVSVDQDFKMSDRMSYTSAGDLWAVGVTTGLGGLAGGLVAATAVNAAGQRDPNSEIREFVRAEFTRALAAEVNPTGLLKVLPSPQGEGRMQVRFFDWGFVAHPFTGKMRARVTGEVRILDASGRKIWKCIIPNAFSEELKATQEFRSADLKGNMPVIKQELARQVKLLARDVARYMSGKK